jgi:hypothetical protein
MLLKDVAMAGCGWRARRRGGTCGGRWMCGWMWGRGARWTAGGVWLDEHDLWLYLDDGTLLRLTLVEGAGSYAVSANAELRLGIRASRTDITSLALSDPSDWDLPGGWAEADRAAGRVSARLQTITVEPRAALAAALAAVLTGVVEVQMQYCLPEGGRGAGRTVPGGAGEHGGGDRGVRGMDARGDAMAVWPEPGGVPALDGVVGGVPSTWLRAGAGGVGDGRRESMGRGGRGHGSQKTPGDGRSTGNCRQRAPMSSRSAGARTTRSGCGRTASTNCGACS